MKNVLKMWPFDSRSDSKVVQNVRLIQNVQHQYVYHHHSDIGDFLWIQLNQFHQILASHRKPFRLEVTK